MMMSQAMRRLFVVLLTCCLLAAMTVTTGPWSAGAAWAQDDDDDDGGDDDDDDDGGNTGAGQNDSENTQVPVRKSVRKTVRKAPTPRRAAVVRTVPDFAPEIVALGLSADDLAILRQEGYRVLETQPLISMGADLLRLAPPKAIALSAARDRIRQLSSGTAADLNHYYRTNEGVVPASADVGVAGAGCEHANCAAFQMVQWPSAVWRKSHCPAALPVVGVIDTGVNAAHDLVAGSQIEVVRLGPDDAGESRQIHGTAVLSALSGQVGSRVEGLLPEARFLVADVFSVTGDDERADVFSLMRGLDLMGTRGIRVVNLSLSGPTNAVLADITQRLLAEKQMILVAAVGNGGKTRPVAYPAAIPGVIGVTAVDRRGRHYGSAQRGPEVDIAAPGVGLLLATSVKGAKEKTGTSFAAPFVTASAALLIAADPLLTPEQVALHLAASVRDLGKEGKDPLFGAGLLQTADLCQ